MRDSKEPDKPLLIVGYNTYSPRQILEEVRGDTKFGREFLTKIQNLASEYGVNIPLH